MILWIFGCCDWLLLVYLFCWQFGCLLLAGSLAVQRFGFIRFTLFESFGLGLCVGYLLLVAFGVVGLVTRFGCLGLLSLLLLDLLVCGFMFCLRRLCFDLGLLCLGFWCLLLGFVWLFGV